ncbi:hypothetical protein CJU89_1417 [Yarrowia sp. B02]|nr:hypothetical protein CJU89_1417 [Yarrowia sp. B02]
MAIHHSFKISKKSVPAAKNKATLRPAATNPIVDAFGLDMKTDGPEADFQWDLEAIENSRVVFPLAPEAWETTFAAAEEPESQGTAEDDTTLEITEEKELKDPSKAIPGWMITGDSSDTSYSTEEEPPECFDWIKLFFEENGNDFTPLDLSSHFQETLKVSLETYTPGSVTNPIVDGYVVSGKSTHAYFSPITGAMTPWVHQPALRNSKDKQTNTTLRSILNTDCLNVGDPSYWWNVRVSSNYCHLGEVSSNRVVAGLFNMNPTDALVDTSEICVIRCFQPYAKEASHTSQFYTFQPQKNEKYMLNLAGSPTTNLFLVESYKGDVHYIYLLTSSLNSALPHYKLVLQVSQISRTRKSGNLRGKKWWSHRILTFGENLAIFKEGRLAVWRLVYDAINDSVKAFLLPQKYGFVADVHPAQFGRHLVFSRGVLDMSTFEFCTVPVGQNGRKKIVWHKRRGELVGSTVSNLSFQCFYLGEAV